MLFLIPQEWECQMQRRLAEAPSDPTQYLIKPEGGEPSSAAHFVSHQTVPTGTHFTVQPERVAPHTEHDEENPVP